MVQDGHEYDVLRGIDPLLLVVAVVVALILAGAFL
jgi:hypothetical protein